MSRNYAPRRQSSRWLDGNCPADVLCILDDGPRSFDRWTVFYRHVWIAMPSRPELSASLFGRGMSDHPTHAQGVGCSLEMHPRDVAALRYRQRSTKFSTLPPDVQTCIIADCRPGGLGSRLDDNGIDLLAA